MCGTDFLTPNPEFSTRWPHPDLQSRVSEKCSAVGTGYPRARRALHVEQRCSTLAPVGRLGRRKLAASLARRATIFDRISKDFAPPKPQNFPRAAPYGRGRPTAGALRARRPTGVSPRSDPHYEARFSLDESVGTASRKARSQPVVTPNCPAPRAGDSRWRRIRRRRCGARRSTSLVHFRPWFQNLRLFCVRNLFAPATRMRSGFK